MNDGDVYRYLKFTRRQVRKVQDVIDVIDEVLSDIPHDVQVTNIVNWAGLIIPTIVVRAPFRDEGEMYEYWAKTLIAIKERLGVTTVKSVELIFDIGEVVAYGGSGGEEAERTEEEGTPRAGEVVSNSGEREG